MNYANPIAWFAHHQAQQQKQQEDNQKLLFRQLFIKAKNFGYIQINGFKVTVPDKFHREAVYHFNNHPDLFNHAYGYDVDTLLHDKPALEQKLSIAWQYVMSPTPMPHF